MTVESKTKCKVCLSYQGLDPEIIRHLNSLIKKKTSIEELNKAFSSAIGEKHKKHHTKYLYTSHNESCLNNFEFVEEVNKTIEENDIAHSKIVDESFNQLSQKLKDISYNQRLNLLYNFKLDKAIENGVVAKDDVNIFNILNNLVHYHNEDIDISSLHKTKIEKVQDLEKLNMDLIFLILKQQFVKESTLIDIVKILSGKLNNLSILQNNDSRKEHTDIEKQEIAEAYNEFMKIKNGKSKNKC